jgi:aquaporin Z
MKEQNASPFSWRLCLSELVGTALLVLIGLSLVILMFGRGSPIIGIVPSEGLRRLITGFLFGTTGALIALSPVGKESGAHINPVVTLGFWLMRKIGAWTALGYVVAQLLGASAGALPLLVWGSMGRSVVFGATLPGEGYSLGTVLMGEAVTTFALISGLCVFLAFRNLRPFTPAMFPFLYAVMVYVESPI